MSNPWMALPGVGFDMAWQGAPNRSGQALLCSGLLYLVEQPTSGAKQAYSSGSSKAAVDPAMRDREYFRSAPADSARGSSSGKVQKFQMANRPSTARMTNKQLTGGASAKKSSKISTVGTSKRGGVTATESFTATRERKLAIRKNGSVVYTEKEKFQGKREINVPVNAIQKKSTTSRKRAAVSVCEDFKDSKRTKMTVTKRGRGKVESNNHQSFKAMGNDFASGSGFRAYYESWW